MINGGCHCGAVKIAILKAPEYINFCDCSLCAKSGGAWGYFTLADVKASGETSHYRRADYENPAVEMRFCPKCGTTTHWILTEEFNGERIGVNMRIFDPAELAGVEGRTLDGRNWFGDTEPKHRRPAGIIGQDVFL